MTEVWLQANRRLTWLPVAGALLLAAVFALILINTEFRSPLHIFAASAAPACMGLSLWLLYVARRPRLAFDGRSLLMRIRNGSPIAVPIELVEAFLIGKGPAYLSGKDDYKTETQTLIVRISERAPEFEKLETNLRLAAWCGHYVTIRGTFTEPLDLDVVNRLNRRLYDVQQKLKSAHVEAAASPAS
ncbi:MAG: hypothetical protein QM775_13570 [Pirellulales bacterium]